MKTGDVIINKRSGFRYRVGKQFFHENAYYIGYRCFELYTLDGIRDGWEDSKYADKYYVIDPPEILRIIWGIK